MAARKIETKVFFFSTLLNMTKDRVSTCTMALSGEKTKRGILDIGGTALKWLFGVSTQSDLMERNTEMEKKGIQQQQIVHLLDKQATIVNQTQQIAHSSLLLIQQLQKRSELLQTKIDYALDYIQQGELIHIQQMEYFAELDSTFASLDYVFPWFQQQLEAWEIGLATLANGQLSPQIISPTELQTILLELNKQLPLGWKVLANDLRVLYREATVTVAMIRNAFRRNSYIRPRTAI
jgi:hypothetical protein